MAVEVRAVERGDEQAWCAMRTALWPEGSPAEHAAEAKRFLAGRASEPLAVLVAQAESGELVGFVELSIRPHAEGCHTDRVAYLEGWFVAPAWRRRGVGRALVAAAEAWGRAQGCAELASDTEPDNALSAAAHRAAGFEDAGLVRCFRKSI